MEHGLDKLNRDLMGDHLCKHLAGRMAAFNVKGGGVPKGSFFRGTVPSVCDPVSYEGPPASRDCGHGPGCEMPDNVNIPEDMIDKARVLDTHYISPRYPNSHPEGAPFTEWQKLRGQGKICQNLIKDAKWI